MFKKVSLLSMAFVIASKAVMAGGFSLTEYSTTSFGRAFAGLGIVGDDYSAIISNPAGMSLVKDDGVQLGMSLIDIYAKISDNRPGKDDEISLNIFSPVPSFFMQTTVSDKMKLGMALYTPYGLGTDYKDGWFGRDEALLSEIVVYDFTVSSSYDLTDKFSIGASLSTQYATADLTNDVASGAIYSEIEGHSDPTLAYTLGLMYRPTDNTRFGLSYRSKSTYDLEGTHTLKMNTNIPGSNLGMPSISYVPAGTKLKGDAWASVTLPENVILSAYQKIDDLGLSASVKWTRWSRFEYLNIYSNAKGKDERVSSTYENWQDTWTYAIGADYDLNKDWVLRAGIEYDETPIPGDANRTARIPDDDRIITSLGASYKFNGGKFDMAYAHIFLDGGNAQYPSGFDAEYDLHINMLSFAVQYYF